MTADTSLVARCDDARYEFRAWRARPELIDRLEREATFDEPEEIVDHYIVGALRSSNVKIREDVVQTKRLLDARDGFERWCPTWEMPTPLDRGSLTRLWAEFGLVEPDETDTPVAKDELISLAEETAGLRVVEVRKRRRHGDVEGVSTELTDVCRGNRRATSITIEGTDLELLGGVRRHLGLEGTENLPVHVAITDAWKDVAGLGA